MTTPAKSARCRSAQHQWLPGYVGYRKRNGVVVAGLECGTCGHVATALGVKLSDLDPSLLRVARDRTSEARPCRRCGSPGTEIHHWAPREVFGVQVADSWPTDPLCRECHTEWHRKMLGDKPRASDAESARLRDALAHIVGARFSGYKPETCPRCAAAEALATTKAKP